MRFFLKLFYLFTALVVVVNMAICIKDSLFFDIQDLPSGRLIRTVESPDKSKELNLYIVSNSLGTAVRGEVTSGEKEHNIFWQTGIDDVEVHWVDDDFVDINGVNLDTSHGGFYDCRRGTSLFQEGALMEQSNKQ